ncbi:MAG: HEAT repeat domain-containing protein [bacterium]|nr:HEAT repeat domain-containing protein [bacterium]
MNKISRYIDGWLVIFIAIIGVWWLIAGGTPTTASEIEALSKSTDPAQWIEALKSDDRTLRNYARENMANVLPPEALGNIATDILESGDLEMSDAGLWILTQSDATNRGEIAATFLDNENADIRKTALQVLVGCPFPGVHDKIRELTQNPDREVQAVALQALAALGNSDDLNVFISFLGNTNASVRDAAHEAILKLSNYTSGPGIFFALFDVANGSDLAAAREAFELFGEIGDTDALDFLFNFLENGPIGLLSDAAGAIAAIGGEEARNRAYELFLNGDDHQRAQAAKVLGVIGNHDASAALWAAITDESEDFWVRYNSMEALATCGDESMVEEILTFLAIPDHDMRLTRAGIEALGGLDGARVIELYDHIIAGDIDFDLNSHGGDLSLLSVIAGLGKMDNDESRARLRELALASEQDNFELLIDITKAIGNVGVPDDIDFLIELEQGKPVLSGFVDSAIENIHKRYPE